jgi:hypothetical protein
MTDQNSQQNSDEIDLSVLFDKIKSLFKSILIGIVQIFQFFWTHKIRLFIVLVIGIGLQYVFSTQVDKIYVNEYLIRTNFNSTEYLYSKVKAINAKLKSDDSLYLKDIFGKHYKRIDEIKAEPVVDVYGLVNRSEENREVFELLLDEFGDISFLEEEINVNEYPTHKIKIYINGLEDNESISSQAFNYLSSNPYYNELKQTALESYKEQLDQNKVIRRQIDSILADPSASVKMPKLDNNAISFTGSQDLRELLTQKKELLNNDLTLRNQLSTNNEVLKTIDSSFGVFSKDRNRSPFIIPFSLIGIYILFFFFRYLRGRISSVVN